MNRLSGQQLEPELKQVMRRAFPLHSLACCFPTDETDEEEEIIEEYPQKETRRKKVRVRMEIQIPNTLYCLEYSLITST